MGKNQGIVKEGLRIGVFICRCGINIGGVVNIGEVLEYVKALPNVAYVEENMYTCSAEGISFIKKAISEHVLNRVIVAACTPRTHEPLFRVACQDAGLNPYLFEFANIREHCSWVHVYEPEKATEKAKRIIRMSVARSAFLEPLKDVEVKVDPSVLIIGAGISGITAALNLANRGFKVYLVEKEAEIGGMLRKIFKLYPTAMCASDIIYSLTKKVMDHGGITLYTSTTIENIAGYIGNFDVTALKEGGKEIKFKVGTIIIATGAEEFKPIGMYGYGKYKGVITQLELEQILKEKAVALQSIKPRKVVMIQCVGSREEDGRAYCSRICCMVSVKNAMLIKELCPDMDVYILYQDFQTYGKDYEEHHRRAKERGITLVHYAKDRPPEVIADTEGKFRVKVYNALLGREIEVESGLVVLSTPLIQHEGGKKLSKLLKVPLGQDEFFLEAHMKLRPVDFATDGIYVCGTAQGPKDIGESIAQAYAASSRAGIPMMNRSAKTEAITAIVDLDLCNGCKLCEKLCPYGAHRIEEGKSTVIEILCKGCGVCGAACPRQAITMKHFTDNQISAAIRAAFREIPTTKELEPKILGFLCNWCSYAGADMAGVSRMQYPPNIQIIRTMCSGRVDPAHILEALRFGSDCVLVTGCHLGDCHYITGNYMTEKRVRFMKRVLEKIGIEPDRLRLKWVSASEGKRFAELVKDAVEEFKARPFKPTEKLLKTIDAAIEAFKTERLRSMLGTLLLADARIDMEKYVASMEKVMGDELERHMILNEIREKGPLTAKELSNMIDITLEKTLRHIAYLKKVGIITEAGKKRDEDLYEVK